MTLTADMAEHIASHKARMDRAPARDEAELRRVMAGVFRKQAAATPTDPDKVKFTDADHKAVVDAVRPVLMRVFKKGGDKALRSIRRFPGKAKREQKSLRYSHHDVYESAGVSWDEFKLGLERWKQFAARDPALKASASVTALPEWIEDPEVIDALEDEMFYFAQEIDQNTADALRDALLEGMEAGESVAGLKARVQDLGDEWAEGYRAECVARTESCRAYSKGHVEAWRSTGVVDRKVWVAAGDACPFCRDMDGTVVGLDENFFDEGDEQEVDWEGKTLVMSQDYSDVVGPPLHPNCRCAVVGELAEEKMLALKGDFEGHPFRGNQWTDGLVSRTEDTEEARETVSQWKKKIEAGDRTPVVVDATNHSRVVDGNHRLRAYRELEIVPPVVEVNRIEFLERCGKEDTMKVIAELGKPVLTETHNFPAARGADGI